MRPSSGIRFPVVAVLLTVSAVAAGEDLFDVRYHKLDNGLRVVLAPDDTTPVVTVAVYFGVGFRNEPRDRTGFAHLFEHLFFEGSESLERGQLVQLISGNGGVVNAVTRVDFTAYLASAPSHLLDSMLWAEADRMEMLSLSKSGLTRQKQIVINEIRTNVDNRVYGGFPWLDLPQAAFSNWHNAHNFYGDYQHIEAATVKEARRFYADYYTPGNAAVVLIGDFDPDYAKERVKRRFGGIRGAAAPDVPDFSETPQDRERRETRRDDRAPRPALAVGYRMPHRNTDDWFALGLIDQMLLQGEDSRLTDRLVRDLGHTDRVYGGVNLLGNMFNYSGPMLWTIATIHDGAPDSSDVLAEIDRVLEDFASRPPDPGSVARARTKLRSSFLDTVGTSTRWGLADILASYALFDDDPTLVNRLFARFDTITPRMIQSTAKRVLRRHNRTVLTISPGSVSR